MLEVWGLVVEPANVESTLRVMVKPAKGRLLTRVATATKLAPSAAVIAYDHSGAGSVDLTNGTYALRAASLFVKV